ncbi:MAG: ATP-binding cassette domain-containing protein [Verrucomicrobia bacterium]|nr:ATP-binding cassette domain-containing protein [Verrucomicrobiota bacterium]
MNSDFWVRLENVTLRDREENPIFPNTNWVWEPGQQWAVLGANGSGKNELAQALTRWIPPLRGRIQTELPPTPECLDIPNLANRKPVMVISPEVHRHILTSESSFYQSRWHNGLDEGSLTAAYFLSHKYVEDINPFEIGTRGADPAVFDRHRQMYLDWMGIAPELLERKWAHLSNGEQRKVLLINALLHTPQMLILSEPFGGLDVQTRQTLKEIIGRLIRLGMPVLTLVTRVDELPEEVTHLLLLDQRRIVAQGTKAEMLEHPLARQQSETVTSSVSSSVTTGPVPSSCSAEPVVEINDVTFEAENKVILDHIRWKIYPGENWALLGPNGSGKTSLLNLIQGDHPLVYSLNIRVMGELYRSTRSLWLIRQKMGWLSPELHLHYPGDWTCLEVVCSGFFHSMGLHTSPNPRQQKTALAYLEKWGLAHLVNTPFDYASIGEQRMVLLARAFVNRPRLIILDEACQGLDAAYRRKLLTAVDEEIRQTDAALIFVTHYADEIPSCINRTLHLLDGKIVSK